MKFALVLLLLCACGPVPPEVGYRRVVASHLKVCIQSTGCIGTYVEQCFARARGECTDAGYPETCGYGEPEASCR